MTIDEIAGDMAQKATTLDPLGRTLLFCLDDELMLVDGTGDANVVSIVSGQSVEADCTVRMSLETYGKLQRKEIKPFMAVASGRIKVKGDMSIAAKLKKLT
ncbi:MAG: SCP2 sterol-binding domain-containing protein [Gammaproteobacteria bacterium]|nr:SCP2 sterol-binding domain-containing protein [Gammaproteobacteria bacterium]